MKVVIREERCVGCDRCADICPDVFAMHDNTAVCRFDGDIPPDFEDACREAAESCPLDAIEIEE